MIQFLLACLGLFLIIFLILVSRYYEEKLEEEVHKTRCPKCGGMWKIHNWFRGMVVLSCPKYHELNHVSLSSFEQFEKYCNNKEG
jgi:hypothetical protein